VETKYRVWDTIEKKMIYNPQVFGGCINEIFNNTGSSFVWQQFTGLKDKHGVDIYAGDVVQGLERRQGETQGHIGTAQVYHSLGGFTLFGKNMQDFSWDKDGGYRIKWIMWCQHGHNSIPNTYWEIVDIEVIDNIFDFEAKE